MQTRIPRDTEVRRARNGDYEVRITRLSRFVVLRLLHVIEQVQGRGDEVIETEQTYLGESLPEEKS